MGKGNVEVGQVSDEDEMVEDEGAKVDERHDGSRAGTGPLCSGLAQIRYGTCYCTDCGRKGKETS